MKYDGSGKFNWKKGDFKAELPQCSDCIRNTKVNECEIYGTKPDEFLSNKATCPYKVPEVK